MWNVLIQQAGISPAQPSSLALCIPGNKWLCNLSWSCSHALSDCISPVCWTLCQAIWSWRLVFGLLWGELQLLHWWGRTAMQGNKLVQSWCNTILLRQILCQGVWEGMCWLEAHVREYVTQHVRSRGSLDYLSSDFKPALVGSGRVETGGCISSFFLGLIDNSLEFNLFRAGCHVLKWWNCCEWGRRPIQKVSLRLNIFTGTL